MSASKQLSAILEEDNEDSISEEHIVTKKVLKRKKVTKELKPSKSTKAEVLTSYDPYDDVIPLEPSVAEELVYEVPDDDEEDFDTTPPVPTKQKNKVSRLPASKSKDTDVAESLDFDTLMNNANILFAEQALQSRQSGEVTPKELELSKAKAENFISSVNNMLEISNAVELLKSDKHKFKRLDELKILNNLKDQFDLAAKYSNKSLRLCASRLDSLYENLEDGTLDREDLETLGSLQAYMDSSVGLITKISKGVEQLIKSERETGGRGGIATGKAASGLLRLFNAKDGDGGDSFVPTTDKPRKLTSAELRSAISDSPK